MFNGYRTFYILLYNRKPFQTEIDSIDIRFEFLQVSTYVKDKISTRRQFYRNDVLGIVMGGQLLATTRMVCGGGKSQCLIEGDMTLSNPAFVVMIEKCREELMHLWAKNWSMPEFQYL